jgi:fluoroacetyl-CoA thioesterase
MPDFSALTAGSSGQAMVVVGDQNLATAVGSGNVAVFASPMMIALMEAACVDCVERQLPPGYLTLGMYFDISHSAPTPRGATVTATAALQSIEGRKLAFAVSANDDSGPIGAGTHTRMIVDRARFEARLAIKRPA